MATKTITLDLEAYRRLREARKQNESFSEAIKRLVRPRTQAAAWIKRASKVTFGREFVDAVEEQVRSRSRASRRDGR